MKLIRAELESLKKDKTISERSKARFLGLGYDETLAGLKPHRHWPSGDMEKVFTNQGRCTSRKH